MRKTFLIVLTAIFLTGTQLNPVMMYGHTVYMPN